MGMHIEVTAKTPAGASNQVFRGIKRMAKSVGQDTTYIMRRQRPGGGWEVVWEEGPFEWAIAASLGGDIWEEELEGTLYQRPPTFPGMNAPGSPVLAEPDNSYSLGFYTTKRAKRCPYCREESGCNTGMAVVGRRKPGRRSTQWRSAYTRTEGHCRYCNLIMPGLLEGITARPVWADPHWRTKMRWIAYRHLKAEHPEQFQIHFRRR